MKFALCLFFLHIGIAMNSTFLNVDLSKGRPLSKFWLSTGFNPAPYGDQTAFLMSEDVAKNLALIGALTNDDSFQVRIHNLLNLDLNALDRIIHLLWSNRLKPGFEIMGNPFEHRLNFDDPDQVDKWKIFIEKLVQRFVSRYGRQEVERWNFETWNEPDHELKNWTISSYLNYYEVVSGVLKQHGLRLGGPGGSCRPPHFTRLCYSLLEHQATTRNKLDFVSFHRKGQDLVNGQLHLMKRLKKDFPALSEMPFFNDEADPMKSWWKTRKWRGNVEYAMKVVKNIYESKEIVSTTSYQLLSNDNAFLNQPNLSYFDQRTLTTRFLCENGQSVLIRKPIYNLMVMLGLLGDLEIPIAASNVISWFTKRVGRQEGNLISVVALFTTHDASTVHLNLTGIDNSTAIATLYKMNGDNTNPRQVWSNLGKPTCPDKHEIASILKATYLKAQRIPIEMPIHLSNSSIYLLAICVKSDQPEQPIEVTLYKEARNITLLRWHYNGELECLSGFLVEHSTNAIDYEIINEHQLEPIPFYQHLSDGNFGWYRLAALDVWGRKGPFSKPVKYNA